MSVPLIDLKRDILNGIESADIYQLAVCSPIEHAKGLSARLKNEIFFKREDVQPVFSFKLRGAFHKLNLLSAKQRQQGVIAASAGNHAQGVALGSKELGIKALIVMPVTTPEIKVDAVRTLGAEVVLHGDNYDDALELMGNTFIDLKDSQSMLGVSAKYSPKDNWKLNMSVSKFTGEEGTQFHEMEDFSHLKVGLEFHF